MQLISLAVFKLFLIIIFGFFLYRKKIIEDKILDFLTIFLIRFSLPFLIFTHLVENLKSSSSLTLLNLVFLSFVIFLVALTLGFIFSFKKSFFKKEFMSLVSFQNCGYLPMNIAFLIFKSPLKEEFLTYIFLYILGFDIIIWSVGSFFIFKKKEENFEIKTLFTPPIIAIILALIFIYSSLVRFLPKIILEPLKMIGDMSFPISVIVLGCWLAKVKLGDFYKRFFIIVEATFLKLIILPLLFLIFLLKFKISSLLGFFIILQTSMPSATNLPIVANLRRADTEFISQGVFFSNIISIITIPFWLDLYLKFSNFSF
ncbi:MAG: AEC family transporter [Candidatus Aenigmatarchaeota archaeon]